MRAVSDLYEHPELSDSEVWDKDAHNRSGAIRVLATMGFFSIAAITTLAACQFSGVVDLSTLHSRLVVTGGNLFLFFNHFDMQRRFFVPFLHD